MFTVLLAGTSFRIIFRWEHKAGLADNKIVPLLMGTVNPLMLAIH